MKDRIIALKQILIIKSIFSYGAVYIHLYSPMNGRKNAKQYKNNAVTLTILKYSATVIEHM